MISAFTKVLYVLFLLASVNVMVFHHIEDCIVVLILAVLVIFRWNIEKSIVKLTDENYEELKSLLEEARTGARANACELVLMDDKIKMISNKVNIRG